MKFSLRWKLILAIGLPLLEVYLIMVAVHYRTSRRAAVEHLQTSLTQLVAHHAARLDGDLAKIAEVADGTARSLSAASDTRLNDMHRLLSPALLAHSEIASVGVAFKPDQPEQTREFAMAMTRGENNRPQRLDLVRMGIDYQVQDWFLLPTLLGKPVWTQPAVNHAGQLTCIYAAPVFAADGQSIRGVVTVEVPMDQINQIANRLNIESGYTTLVSREGSFLVHPNSNLVLRESLYSLGNWHDRPDLADLGRRMNEGRTGVERVDSFLTANPAWIVYSPVSSAGWTFAAVIPEAVILAPVQADLRNSLILLGVGLISILLVVLVTGSRLTRPIVELAAVTRRVAAGDLTARSHAESRRDEIGDLAQDFNAMVEDLESHVRALTEETLRREAVEGELRIARQIQTSLLPTRFPPFPEHREFELHAVNVPAKEVAGDFFDYYFISHDELAIVIADVSGKGVPAAMMMAVCRTLLRSYSRQRHDTLGPGRMLERINQQLAVEENTASMFITLFLGHYNIRTGHLRFANAGHNPPYVVDRHGTPRPLGSSTGAVLGVFPQEQYDEDETDLLPDETLVLYTDGVTEARAPDGMMFESRKFEELLARRFKEPVARLCQGSIDVLRSYQGGKLIDDITIVALRRLAVVAEPEDGDNVLSPAAADEEVV